MSSTIKRRERPSPWRGIQRARALAWAVVVLGLACPEQPRKTWHAEQNQIENGDFIAAERLWAITSLSKGASRAATAHREWKDGALCVVLEEAESVVVGWPDAQGRAVPLQAGQVYQIGFSVRTAGGLPVRLEAKVGHFLEPYTASFVTSVATTSAWQSVSETFVPAGADSAAGVAFILTALRGASRAEVCLDDVALMAVGAGRSAASVTPSASGRAVLPEGMQ